jgi:polyisoprenoid-binding protein YceI
MVALLALLALSASPSPAVPVRDTAAVVWTVDKAHSELLFRVRHLVSRVTGTFTDWDATIVAEPGNWNAGSVTVNVRTASIDTNQERRDTHLRSPDFFETETYPLMTFRSTSVVVRGEEVTLTGDLTIRNVTRRVVLTGTFLGMAASAQGRDRIGFAVSGKVNRLDFGLTWNRLAEAGGLVLADEVTIDVTVAAVRQVAATQP